MFRGVSRGKGSPRAALRRFARESMVRAPTRDSQTRRHHAGTAFARSLAVFHFWMTMTSEFVPGEAMISRESRVRKRKNSRSSCAGPRGVER